MADSQTAHSPARLVAVVVAIVALSWGCGSGDGPVGVSPPTDVGPPPTTIHGQVEPRVAGVGVIGVRNGVAAAIALTDEGGVYALVDIPAGEYNLIASGPGFFTDTSARNVVVGRNEVTEAPPITMRPITAAATLRGRAVDETTGDPLAEVQVTVQCRSGVCSNITALTDGEGRFEVGIWPGLDSRLIFQKAGYASAFVNAAALESGAVFDTPPARLVGEVR